MADWTTQVNTGVPNPARIYDYLLGGKDNFPADREVAEQVVAIAPVARDIVEDNRAFLRRAVRLLAGECGIRQFIDLGSGLPTQGNVHEIAQAMAEMGTKVERLYQLTTTSLVTRPRAQVERFFDGFDLVDPGLVEIQLWRPDESGSLLPGGFYGGVGRRR